MHPDDERLAQLVRLIRRELGMTQAQLARLAAVPLGELKKIEAGRAGEVKLRRVRQVIESEHGRGRLVVWWNGASADRLLDAGHAALVERIVGILRSRGWDVLVEVSFSEYGERGSIDILALRPGMRVAVVIEVKTAFGSLEETNRVLDMKVRLSPALVFKQFGWRPHLVARLLVLPNTSTNRRVVDRHRETLRVIYPARSREVRAWLWRPESALSGIWFVSDGRATSTIRP